MGFKAVIFDLDGTLIDTVDGIAFSMNTVLENHGLTAYGREEYKILVGNGVRELVRKAVARYGFDDEALTRLTAEMRDEYSKNWNYKIRVYDGIEELLDCLSRNAIPAAVNTNKDESVSKTIIDGLLPHHDFRLIAGAGSTPTKKPDPAGALLIARTLGIQPSQCIYMGDSEVDAMTARNAGMYGVGVLWGFRTAEDLRSAGVRELIERPSDILKLLDIGE